MTVSKNKLTYAKRFDRNHKAATRVVRENGYHAVDTNVTGDGFPDVLVVSKVDHRVVVLFEIKVDDEQLREKEVTFFATYPGLAYVVRSGADQGHLAGQQILEIMKGIEDAHNSDRS